jgi:hypothetical protein
MIRLGKAGKGAVLQLSKQERLTIFFERLDEAPPASTHEVAYELLCDTLNSIEDEFNDVPFNPDNWQTDGRMYPPQPDRAYEVDGHPHLTRYKSFKHNTYIGDNGAIEVRSFPEETVLFSKQGADGRGVWEL